MPIATPEVYAEMLDRAKANEFAYPAINVTSSETLNAALRGFAEAQSDGIVQVSTGGAEFASGTKVKDMVTGATALAEYAHVVAAKYPVNIALHTDHCPKDKLDGFVRPLIEISKERVARGPGERGRYLLAATFGNVHGVYKPGNVKLRPEVLKRGQEVAAAKLGRPADAKPFELVFHGGSGSELSEIHESLSYGVVKMN